MSALAEPSEQPASAANPNALPDAPDCDVRFGLAAAIVQVWAGKQNGPELKF